MKMLGTTAAQQARRRHLVLPNGTGYYKGEYMLAPVEADQPSPHAFLIEQQPYSCSKKVFSGEKIALPRLVPTNTIPMANPFFSLNHEETKIIQVTDPAVTIEIPKKK